jgi:hypothetical protein
MIPLADRAEPTRAKIQGAGGLVGAGVLIAGRSAGNGSTDFVSSAGSSGLLFLSTEVSPVAGWARVVVGLGGFVNSRFISSPPVTIIQKLVTAMKILSFLFWRRNIRSIFSGSGSVGFWSSFTGPFYPTLPSFDMSFFHRSKCRVTAGTFSPRSPGITPTIRRNT